MDQQHIIVVAVSFSATMKKNLCHYRHCFHFHLLSPQDFLSKLDLPLQVSSSKLTRWHPKFALDSVADIQVAELPAAPTVVTKTAQQVLESTRGKLPARVRIPMPQGSLLIC